ncbi:hypothetical protein VTO73DRAFT_10578 [Trametes versicolor]
MSIDKTPSDSHRPNPPPGPPTPDDASSVVSFRTDSPVADQGDAFAASVRTSSGRNSGANTRIDNAGDAHVHARGHASGRSATAPTQDRSNAQGDAGARPTDATHPVMPAATNPLPRLPRDRLRENAQAGPSVYSGAMWQHEPAHRVATPPQSILVGGSGARARQPDTPRRPQSGASTVDEGYTTANTPRRDKAQKMLEQVAENIERFHTPHPGTGSHRVWPKERFSDLKEDSEEGSEPQQTQSEQPPDVVPGMCGECLMAQHHTPTSGIHSGRKAVHSQMNHEIRRTEPHRHHRRCRLRGQHPHHIDLQCNNVLLHPSLQLHAGGLPPGAMLQPRRLLLPVHPLNRIRSRRSECTSLSRGTRRLVDIGQ